MAERWIQVLIAFSAVLPFSVQAEEVVAPGSSRVGDSIKDPEAALACKISHAARLSLASIYGSCTAANTTKAPSLPKDTICNADDKQASSLSVVWSGRKEPGCNLKYSAKPSYKQAGARCIISDSTVDPAPDGKTDCSGFVSGVLAHEGLRLTKGELPKLYTTQQIVATIGSDNSCFEAPKKTGGLLPGDMVVWNINGKGHVFLIDRVDASKGCDSFSIIESTGSMKFGRGGSGEGVSIRSIENAAPANGTVSDVKGEAFKRIAKVACGGADGEDGTVKVVRYNPMKGGCQPMPQKKFVNESCVENCNLGQNNG